VLEMGGVPGIAIEIKRASAPTLEKGFTIACEDLGIRQRYVVYPGPGAVFNPPRGRGHFPARTDGTAEAMIRPTLPPARRTADSPPHRRARPRRSLQQFHRPIIARNPQIAHRAAQWP
jgi:hypothetical protein